MYTTYATGVAPGARADAVSFASPWPSPSAGRVNLSYALLRGARVSLSIHDAMGRLVSRLAGGELEPAGRHATVWEGRAESGEKVAPGVYLARLVVDNASYQRRIAVVR